MSEAGSAGLRWAGLNTFCWLQGLGAVPSCVAPVPGRVMDGEGLIKEALGWLVACGRCIVGMGLPERGSLSPLKQVHKRSKHHKMQKLKNIINTLPTSQ